MTPEEMQAMIDGLRPNNVPLMELRQWLDGRLSEIRPMQGEDRQEALDQLVTEISDMSENIDVYDRNQSMAFASLLKSIYDVDVASNDAQYYPRTAQRSGFLQQLKSRVTQGDRRFGIIRNSDRKYISSLFPTYADASAAFESSNYDDETHSILEHMGEAWESFLQLDRPYDQWQEYISNYNRQILSRLIPLQTRSVQAPDEQIPKVPVTVPRPVREDGSRVGVSGFGATPIPMIDPLTGIVSLVAPSSADPSFKALPEDHKTGDRDRFGRKIIVPATLEGLEQRCTKTYRTHGDAVVAFRSDAGGVVSVTITGDTSAWRDRVAAMRIPLALNITEDDADRSITFAYL